MVVHTETTTSEPGCAGRPVFVVSGECRAAEEGWADDSVDGGTDSTIDGAFDKTGVGLMVGTFDGTSNGAGDGPDDDTTAVVGCTKINDGWAESCSTEGALEDAAVGFVVGT